jgi:hypothetical protein
VSSGSTEADGVKVGREYEEPEPDEEPEPEEEPEEAAGEEGEEGEVRQGRHLLRHLGCHHSGIRRCNFALISRFFQ